MFRDQLFNVRATDFSVHFISLGTLFVIATITCLLPAYRASAMDPNRALRTI